MSLTYIPSTLREKVRLRANRRCEYCLLFEEYAHFSHEADHIIAEKHAGETVFDNLAWSCFDCNRHKGSDVASVDPISQKIIPLFNPRTESWHDHFEILDGQILPLTATGRVTVHLLKFNLIARIEVRATLAKANCYP